MFSFTQKPKTSVQLANTEVPINLSFNRVIAAFNLLDQDDLSLEDKVVQCCSIFIGEQLTRSPSYCAEILNDIFEYINQSPYGFDDDEDDEPDDTVELSDIDYEQDAGAIYASFLSYYNIDLTDYIDVMNWDRFKALMDNLGPDTPINVIRKYRNDDPANYKDEGQEKQLQFVAEMKDYYQLDKNAEIEHELEQQQMSNQFSRLFANGK